MRVSKPPGGSPSPTTPTPTRRRWTLRGCKPYLDSRHSRHFADGIANERFAGKPVADALAAAAARWVGWTIGIQIAYELGIPCELSYLTGYPSQTQIYADCVERRTSLRRAAGHEPKAPAALSCNHACKSLTRNAPFDANPSID